MANEVLVKPGANIIWGQNTAAGEIGMSLGNLASSAGRCGAVVDLGSKFASRYSVDLAVEFGTAPTALTCYEVYFAQSYLRLFL